MIHNSFEIKCRVLYSVELLNVKQMSDLGL